MQRPRLPLAGRDILALVAGLAVFGLTTAALLWEFEHGPVRDPRTYDLGHFYEFYRSAKVAALSPAIVLGLLVTDLAQRLVNGLGYVRGRPGDSIAAIVAGWGAYAIVTSLTHWAAAYLLLSGLLLLPGASLVFGLVDLVLSTLVPVVAVLAMARWMSGGHCPAVIQWFLGATVFVAAYLPV